MTRPDGILRDENRGPVDGFDDRLLDDAEAAALYAPDDGLVDDGVRAVRRTRPRIAMTEGEVTELDESWSVADLAAVIDGSAVQPMPTLTSRTDGRFLLYPAAINGIHGDSGAGKGMFACTAVKQELARGRTVVYIDLEDSAGSITGRLLNMGVPAAQIVASLIYLHPQTPFGPAARAHVLALIAEHGPSLVVVDSLGEAFGLEGLNEDKDVDVGPWLRKVPRAFAEAGPAVLLVDHATKSAENPLHPSGSKRKRAAITGASYLAEAVKPFVKGDGGRLKLVCAKDRHGNYRKGEVVANLVMSASLTSAIRLELYAPDPDDRHDDLQVVTAARAAVATAKAEGRPLSKSALRELIKGKTDVRKAGIELAISRGALNETPGPSNSKLLTYVQDLPE